MTSWGERCHARLRGPDKVGATALVALLIAAAAVTPACGRREPQPEAEPQDTAVPVAAQVVETGSLRAVIRASGTIVPAEGAEFLVIAPETARLLEVTKAEGDKVRSGEIVARLELPSATQELARQRAELARAQAQLENARIARQRTVDLVGRGMIPRRDQEDADRQMADAQAAADRVSAAHAAAEAAAARAVVRAPFDGIVSKRLRNPGDVAQGAATDPIMRIVDPRRIEVRAIVDDADAPRVVPGASARLSSPIDSRIVPLTVASRGTGGTVRLTIANATPLPIDAAVPVEIDAEERTGVVFLSPEVVIREGGATVVMVAEGDTARRRLVTVGIATESRLEITSGLRDGELVITRGHVGLEDGAAISVAR